MSLAPITCTVLGDFCMCSEFVGESWYTLQIGKWIDMIYNT